MFPSLFRFCGTVPGLKLVASNNDDDAGDDRDEHATGCPQRDDNGNDDGCDGGNVAPEALPTTPAYSGT